MNTDSLQTVIDSLQNILSTTSNSIEPYTTLIESQQSSYEMFIIILLALLGVNIIVNFTFSRRRLKAEVESVFSEDKPKLIEELRSESKILFNRFKEQNDKNIAKLEGDLARSFYISQWDAKQYNNAFNWALVACSQLHRADSKLMAKLMGEELIKCLKKGIEGIDNKIFLQRCIVATFTIQQIKENIEAIPDYLDDVKLEIKRILFDEENE